MCALPQTIDQLAEVMPECYDQFGKSAIPLENHYRDMQDMEFTIEDKKLYMLQTQKRQENCCCRALKIACDLVDEGMISEKEAVAMIDPRTLDSLLHPQFDAAALKKANRLQPLWLLLRVLHAAVLSLLLTTQKSGAEKGARKLFLSVWRPLRRTLRVWLLLRAS